MTARERQYARENGPLPVRAKGTRSLFALGGFLAAAVAVGGCCADRTFLCRDGTVAVETKSSTSVEIQYACVWQVEEEIIVYGALRRNAYTCCPMTVRVKVVVLSPDGTVVEEPRAPEVGVPRRRHGCKTCSQPFKVNLASAPPAGSRVLVSIPDS